jgi:hypothetical protein
MLSGRIVYKILLPSSGGKGKRLKKAKRNIQTISGKEKQDDWLFKRLQN